MLKIVKDEYGKEKWKPLQRDDYMYLVPHERNGFMKSTMRDLYRGRIIPWERRASHNREQLETLHKLEDEERYFMKRTNPAASAPKRWIFT